MVYRSEQEDDYKQQVDASYFDFTEENYISEIDALNYNQIKEVQQEIEDLSFLHES